MWKNLTICKCDQQKKSKCDIINNTNKYCSYQSFFSLFFWDKKSPNDNIASNFGQKFPFLSKRIGQTSSYFGELVTTNLCTTYNFNDPIHVMLKCWNFGILKMELLVFFLLKKLNFFDINVDCEWQVWYINAHFQYINLKMCIENGKHYSYRMETH